MPKKLNLTMQIRVLLADGAWRTIDQIRKATGSDRTDAQIAARVRALRLPAQGELEIESDTSGDQTRYRRVLTPSERMRAENTLLDPETVGKIWEEEGTYAKVSERLVEAGVVNPKTGRPYSSMSLSRAVRKSSAWKRAQEKKAKRFAEGRAALERARG